MKIPVTKELSTEVDDLVGCLDIPHSIADNMARGLANGIEYKLLGCVEQDGNEFRLRHVSIKAVPVESTQSVR